jgi:hypothetical protein
MFEMIELDLLARTIDVLALLIQERLASGQLSFVAGEGAAKVLELEHVDIWLYPIPGEKHKYDVRLCLKKPVTFVSYIFPVNGGNNNGCE